MLAQQSEFLLKQILDIVCETELVIESHRQSICRNPVFSPYSAFCRIDRKAQELIDSQDLLQFFQDNKAGGVGIGDCAKLIRFFDSDRKGSLNFHQFLQTLLPCESACLRKQVQQRPYMKVGHFDALPYQLENQLIQLLMTEIDLQKRVQMLMQDLEKQPDYTVQSAFRAIDCFSEGFLNIKNLSHFFRKHGDYLIENEIFAVIRRIDIDGDARISFSEFKNFFQNHLSPDAKLVPNKKRAQSAFKPNHRAQHLETKPQNAQFNLCVQKQKPQNVKKQELLAAPQFKSDTHALIVQFLMDTVRIERDVEHARHEIIVKADFNICDAFRIFDLRECGFVSLQEFRDGLCDIGVIVPFEHLQLLFNRYDRDVDGLMSFSDFTDAMTPFETYYATIIRRRMSSHRKINPFKKIDVFEHHTGVQLRNTLVQMIQAQYDLEKLRQKINRNPMFNIELAFKCCDLNGNGIVSKDEFRIVLESQGHKLTDQEARNLTSKFDKHDNKCVTWREFADELKPRIL